MLAMTVKKKKDKTKKTKTKTIKIRPSEQEGAGGKKQHQEAARYSDRKVVRGARRHRQKVDRKKWTPPTGNCPEIRTVQFIGSEPSKGAQGATRGGCWRARTGRDGSS